MNAYQQETEARLLLYPTSRRQIAVARNSARAVVAAGRPTQGSKPMSAATVHPETARRRMLIAALDEPTLRALVTHGDQDDANMARVELMHREGPRSQYPVRCGEVWEHRSGVLFRVASIDRARRRVSMAEVANIDAPYVSAGFDAFPHDWSFVAADERGLGEGRN